MPVHEHYGTGIASGLVDRPGYAVGGRVNLQEGGDPSLIDQAKEKAVPKIKEATKEDLFEGGSKPTGFGKSQFNKLSPLAQAYNVKLYNILTAQGLTMDMLNDLSFEEQQELVQIINDQIFNSLMSDYNVSFEQINDHFGGNNAINNAFKTIKRQLKMKPELMSEITTNLQNELNTKVASMKEISPNIFESPQVTTSGLPGVATGTMTGTDDNVTQAGLMGLDKTGEDFRQRYVDYLQQLQDETGVAEKRKREAVEAGFFNLGAADPVQPGESLVRAGIQAFRDPMAALRAQEAVQAEDIYKRGADVLDEALSPSDSANVLLIQDLVEAGIPRPQAIDMVLGLTQARSKAVLEALQDPQFRAELQGLMVDAEGQPTGVTQQQAIRQLLGFDIPQTAEEITAQQQQANLGAQTITQQGITAPTLGMGQKDGGRVGLQDGGALAEAVTQEQMGPTAINAGSPSVSPMSFDELREKLPDYISDDVIKLLAENPMALMELAQAQTDRDLKEFEKKYQVDVTMPLAESEVDYAGAV